MSSLSPLLAAFQRGGVMMWPLLLACGSGLCYALERAWALRRGKQIPKGFAKNVVQAVDTRGTDAGLSLCAEKNFALARVFRAALLRQGAPLQALEAAAVAETRRVRADLMRNLRSLALLAALAPVLGLVGCLARLARECEAIGPLSIQELRGAAVAEALVALTCGLLVGLFLLSLHQLLRAAAADIAEDVESQAVAALVTLDRKARQSIRLIEEHLEDALETKNAPGLRPPDLSAELAERPREGVGVRTDITTHASLPVVKEEKKT